MSKFKVGVRVKHRIDGSKGTVVDAPSEHQCSANSTLSPVVWVQWDNADENNPLLSHECVLKLVKLKKTGIDTEINIHVDVPEDETYIDTIEFKNAIVPVKNCFRGAVVKWKDGMFGHVVGFVLPKEGTPHDTLYCNFYGNHYYIKAIELEMM